MKKQTGSAHIVAIVCLVLALVTALGWVFYQNYLLDKDESIIDSANVEQTNQSNKTDATDSNKVEEAAKKDLDITFTDWGVGADYDTTKAVIKYKKSSGSDLLLIGEKLDGLQNCDYGTSGSIVR